MDSDPLGSYFFHLLAVNEKSVDNKMLLKGVIPVCDESLRGISIIVETTILN